MGFYLEEALTSLRKEPNRTLPSEVQKNEPFYLSASVGQVVAIKI